MTEKDIIIEVLQSYMVGKVDPSSNFRPQDLADALVKKIDFSKPINESSWNKFNSLRTKLNEGIQVLDEDMKKELEALKIDEKLFANFLRGKLTAYAEIMDLLKKI